MEEEKWNDINKIKPKHGQLCALVNEFHHGIEDSGLGYYREIEEGFQGGDGSTYWWRYWVPLPTLPEDA
jgi:hypothetical protein